MNLHANCDLYYAHFQCYKLAEDYEELIEDWYYHHQDKDLMNFLCADKFLPDKKFSAGKLPEYKPRSQQPSVCHAKYPMLISHLLHFSHSS